MPDATPVDELEAMRAVLLALDPLDADARRRAVRWLADVYGVGGAPALDEDAIVKMAAGWAADVLDMLDPRALQQAALDGLGFGDDADITAPLFRGIKAAWARAAGTEDARALWPST